MTTPTSGYKLTITAFLPCTNTLADMLAASARLEDLRKAMEAAGLVDVKRSGTFVKGTRAKGGDEHGRRRQRLDEAPVAEQTASNGGNQPRPLVEGGGEPAAADCEHPEKMQAIVRTAAENGIYCRRCGNRIGDAPAEDLLAIPPALQRPKPGAAA